MFKVEKLCGNVECDCVQVAQSPMNRVNVFPALVPEKWAVSCDMCARVVQMRMESRDEALVWAVHHLGEH